MGRFEPTSLSPRHAPDLSLTVVSTCLIYQIFNRVAVAPIVKSKRRFAESRVAPDPGTGGGILRRARGRNVLPEASRPHVRRADRSVRAGQTELRRRVATAHRAGERGPREAILSGQPAGHIRHGTDRGPGGQRVPRQRFSGSGREGNPILFPQRYCHNFILFYIFRFIPGWQVKANFNSVKLKKIYFLHSEEVYSLS